jgi:hypothetical protein
VYYLVSLLYVSRSDTILDNMLKNQIKLLYIVTKNVVELFKHCSTTLSAQKIAVATVWWHQQQMDKLQTHDRDYL